MMKKLTHSLTIAIALFGVAAVVTHAAEKKDAAPQKAKKAPPLPGAGTGGNTPHATTSAVIDGNRVTIVYGRPNMKHPRTGQVRKIWGELVPYGKVWRTGADEATLLITQQPIDIGGKVVPAGAYTLWTLPSADGSAKLIVNRQIGQWGADRDFSKIYNEANDVVRVDLTKKTLSTPVEQFTMGVERASGGGAIKLAWDTVEYSAPFTVKN